MRTPCFGKQFADGGRLELSKEGTTVDRPEVADVAHPVELLGDYCEAGSLLEIKARWGHEVTGRKEVGHLRADVVVRSTEHLLDIPFYERSLSMQA